MHYLDEKMAKIDRAMGNGVDVSLDGVGFNKTTPTALDATQAGGKVCLVGLGPSEMTIPITPAAARHLIYDKHNFRC